MAKIKTRYRVYIAKGTIPPELVAYAKDEEHGRKIWEGLAGQNAYLMCETFEVIADHRKPRPDTFKGEANG